MNRKAILIESSNVQGLKDLPGARKDVENWNEFLRSNLGGAWSTSEIYILHKPLSADLKRELTVSLDCYCFIAFSGHGEEGSIALNDYYTEYPVTELIPKCDKATVILDSCRGIQEAAQVQFSLSTLRAKAALVESIAIQASSAPRGWLVAKAFTNTAAVSNAQNPYYANWNYALSKCAKGILQMLACSKGETAGEDPNSGGAYTSLLLQSAIEWNRRQTTEEIHSTKDAHNYAAPLLQPQQVPEYFPDWLAFPFGVKA